jgi:Fe-S cluster assembly scaffold protein SufB
MPKRAVAGKAGTIESGVAQDADSATPDGETNTGSVGASTDRLQFPEEHKEAFRGLLYVGSLSDVFEYAGHKFEIQTLREGQLLKAAQLVAQYEHTLGHELAYNAALVSASIVSVDGEVLYTPIAKDEDVARKRFEAVLQWYPIVVDNVYMKVVELDNAAAAIGAELGKA